MSDTDTDRIATEYQAALAAHKVAVGELLRDLQIREDIRTGQATYYDLSDESY